MSTESSSAPLRECPNRECKRDGRVIYEEPCDMHYVTCKLCGLTGPAIDGGDYPTKGTARAEARRLWNALPREGDVSIPAADLAMMRTGAAQTLLDAVKSVPDGDHVALRHVESDRITLIIEASAFRALVSTASLPREGDAKAGPVIGAYTERLVRVLRESVRYVGDHRKVWIVTKDRDDVSKTWILAAAIKCAIKELEEPRG